ncbi:MAG: GNAT family N-acetyltransferase [Chloroflexota bacterium]|jgi:ribosomal protein S18 acetylase RimI-like enzyme
MDQDRSVTVRGARDDEELKRLTRRVRSTWGESVVRRGEAVDPADGELIGAFVDEEIIGVATYAVRGAECEVVAIEAYQQRHGIATALMDEIRTRAEATGCSRLWLVTTNDNVPAIGFYQKWGMDLALLRRDSVTEARARLKPSIPETGYEDIPIRHELEFEVQL